MATHTDTDTIPALFWRQVKRHGDRVALRKKDFGIWQEATWTEYGDHVRACAFGLIALGLQPGERVAILSEDRPEWFYADLAVQSAGGISAGIFATNSAEQCGYVVDHAEARIWIVEDQEQFDKAMAVRDGLSDLRWIVVIDPKGLRDVEDPMVLTFAELQERGRILEQAEPERLRERLDAVRPDDTAILFYTSGTTGIPKGVMHSHRSFQAGFHTLDEMIDACDSDEALCYLPLCHIGERILFLMAVYYGYTVNFAERPETVFRDVREVSPTAFLGVPRIWEKLKAQIDIGMAEATWAKRLLYNLCLKVGHRSARCRFSGNQPSALLRALNGLADAVVLRKLRKRIGLDRLRYASVSAAPVAPEVLVFFHAIGIPMREGYGQTETGMTVWTPEADIRPGVAGQVLPGVAFRIGPEGELLWRSPGNMQGYFKNPELTAEVLQDGWFRSGDAGTVDDDGFLTLTGRTKDMMVTAAGRNVYPQAIENMLKASDYIMDAVLIGDRRPYLTALIVLDEETASHYAQTHSIPFSTYANLAARPEIVRLINTQIQHVNRRWSDREQIHDFRILKWELSSEDEELTPTMKVRRKFICDRYADLIEEMYREG